VIVANVMVCAVGVSTLNVWVTVVAGAYVVGPDTPPACTASTEHKPGPVTSTEPTDDTVQIPTDVLGVTRYVTVNGESVVALTLKLAAVVSFAVNALKVIVCAVAGVAVTLNVDVTLGADAQSVPVPSVPPGCDALIVQSRPAPEPPDTSVMVEPDMVQTLVVVDVNVMGRPDGVVA